MNETRPVTYIKTDRVEDENAPLGIRFDKQERKGVYYGIAKGLKQLRGTGVDTPYDFGLVEDTETGQLKKVELDKITFTDRTPQEFGDL